MAIVRVNFDAYEEGEQYRFRLIDEANSIFQIFLSMLSSYWQSSIDGPAYAREIKSMSIELARVRLALDDVRQDIRYASTRTEFIYQVLTSIMFPADPGAPDPHYADQDFRELLIKILEIYFAGSVPASIKAAAELFVNGKVVVREAFLEARKPGSGLDISDEFGFMVDVILDSPSSTDVILADRNIRILLNIIRPAHTLLRIKYILQDEWPGQVDPDPLKDQTRKILDSVSVDYSDYSYEDLRRHTAGVFGVDELGTKRRKSVVGEDHSSDF